MAQQLPRTLQPPPDLPDLGANQNTLATYLRTFSLWCRHGFADKLSQTTATPALMMQTDDVPPAVYQLKVTSGPTLTLAPMTLGSGDVGDPVPVAQAMTGPTSIRAVPGDPEGAAYLAFYSADWATRYGYVGHAGVEVRLANDVSGGQIAINDDGWTYFSGSMMMNGPLQCQAGFNNQPGSYATIFNAGGWIGQASGCNLMVQGAGPGNSAMMTFHCPGEFACQFGMHGDGIFHVGGWSYGAGVWYQVWTSRDFANPACDYRIKQDIEPLDSTWETVKALKPIRYRQKEFALPIAEKYPVVEADERERWGFIAHELQETLGDTAAHCPKDDEGRLQAPNMMMLVAALTKTVQELQARVEQLEAR